MPSASLQHWVNDRVPRLTEIEAQCATSTALVLSNPRLREENLRGYIMLLSAHFQGFCRDLYTESAQITAFRVRLRFGSSSKRNSRPIAPSTTATPTCRT